MIVLIPEEFHGDMVSVDEETPIKAQGKALQVVHHFCALGGGDGGLSGRSLQNFSIVTKMWGGLENWTDSSQTVNLVRLSTKFETLTRQSLHIIIIQEL